MAESDFSGKFVFCQKGRKRAKKIRNFQNFQNFQKKYFSFFFELSHSKQEKAIKFFENVVGLPLDTQKKSENFKNILIEPLIQFESSDLARNGLKRFLLLYSNTEHHTHMWKNSEIWPKRA